jgi:hypothetical protein
MIDLPIQNNVREGFSLTESINSRYGACKGVLGIARIRKRDFVLADLIIGVFMDCNFKYCSY